VSTHVMSQLFADPTQRELMNPGRSSIDVLSDGQLKRVVLANDTIRAIVLPQLGGKMSSLVNIETRREFLLQPSDRPLLRASYGAPFEAFDTSGFDECFPTVAECQYPDGPFAGTALPDHGEVWPVPWQYEVREDELLLAITGVRLPYVFRKRIRLAGGAVEIRYALASVSDKPFKYLWSCHPLLAVEAGAEIVLPTEVNDLFIGSSTGNRLGAPGDRCAWSRGLAADGSPVILNALAGPTQKTAEKLFTPRLSHGYCGLYFPSTDEAIVFRFDPQVVPFVGLWICQGGWPADRTGHFTVALEPCNGRPDSLAEAIARNECRELLPHTVHRWTLRIEIHQGDGKSAIPEGQS